MYIYIHATRRSSTKFAKRVLFVPFSGSKFIYPPLHANKNPQRPRVALVAANEIRSSNYNGSTRWWKIFDRAI